MNPEQIAATAARMSNSEIATVLTALVASDLYINSYDTSAPSRIKAMTRLAIEEAMAVVRSQVQA